MTEKLRPDEKRPPIRSGWNTSKMLIAGPLTDRRIEQYQKAGWYSAAFKKARKERMDQKSFQKKMRHATETFTDGNFIQFEGRLIYSPK